MTILIVGVAASVPAVVRVGAVLSVIGLATVLTFALRLTYQENRAAGRSRPAAIAEGLLDLF